MIKRKDKVIVVVGPTASGKSALAVKLAKQFEGEIVSADSRQIYKGMDIGTGKITKKEMEGIKHYLIDVVTPKANFTLTNFKDMAEKKIQKILDKGKVPIITGGTGLYVAALVDNWQIPRVEPDEENRKILEEMSLKKMQEYLKKHDPKTYQKIDLKNKRRVARAVEVVMATGKSFIKLQDKKESKWDALWIGVGSEREKLYKKIETRVEKMFKMGLLEEVQNLAKKYDFSLGAMSGIGYRQFKDYFEGKISLKEVGKLIKRDTRRYAKRQMTWFKREKRIYWITNSSQAKKLVKDFLNN
jgi:tRNA dimethylallyltransferase